MRAEALKKLYNGECALCNKVNWCKYQIIGADEEEVLPHGVKLFKLDSGDYLHVGIDKITLRSGALGAPVCGECVEVVSDIITVYSDDNEWKYSVKY